MKRLWQNYLYQLLYQLTSLILPVITVPLVAEVLGADGLGTFNFINAIVNCFVLAAGLGIQTYGTREIAKVSEEPSVLRRCFSELAVMNGLVTLVVTLVYGIFCWFTGELRSYFWCQGLILVGAFADVSWFFYGIQRVRAIALRNFGIKLFSFLCIIKLVKQPSDLWIYFLINGGAVCLGQVSLWWTARRYFHLRQVAWERVIKHAEASWRLMITRISVQLFEGTGKIILGLSTSMAAVGYFSMALSLLWVAGSLVGSLNQVLLPLMTQISDHKEHPTVVRRFLHLQAFAALPMMAGLMVVAGKLVPWFFGEGFAELHVLLPVMAPILVLQLLQDSLAFQFLIPRGLLRVYRSSVWQGLGLQVVITLLLVPLLGVYGAALGLISAYLLISYQRLDYFRRVGPCQWQWDKLQNYALGAVGMALCCQVLTYNMPASWQTILWQVFIGGVSYPLCVTLIFSLRKSFFKGEAKTKV